MNKTTGNFKQNSQLKSSQQKPQSMQQFEQPLVQKLRAKISKLMPFKKVAVGPRKQGTLGAKSYNSWVRRKVWSGWEVLSISVVVPLLYIRIKSTECLPNDLGTRENDIVLPSPTPPTLTHTQWFWEQVRGKWNFVQFRDQANSGTGIPCGGIITDLSNRI